MKLSAAEKHSVMNGRRISAAQSEREREQILGNIVKGAENRLSITANQITALASSSTSEVGESPSCSALQLGTVPAAACLRHQHVLFVI